MLLLRLDAPLLPAVRRAVEAIAADGAPVIAREDFVDGYVVIGSVGQDDALDEALDPAVGGAPLEAALRDAGVSAAFVPALARSIADREGVVVLEGDGARSISGAGPRPPTLFEAAALRDVLGDELVDRLPFGRVRIEPAPRGHAHNDCRVDGSGAVLRMLATNGTTLAGRTHAVVHELGHALVGFERLRGNVYRAPYGRADYGYFLRRNDGVAVDEEAMVRAVADAWLLRRRAVTWSRTWPGAIDEAGRGMDADVLAGWARGAFARGLGLAGGPARTERGRPR